MLDAEETTLRVLPGEICVADPSVELAESSSHAQDASKWATRASSSEPICVLIKKNMAL